MADAWQDGSDGGKRRPSPPAPVARFVLAVLTVVVFVVTRQPFVVVLAVVLGAPLFEPIFGWLTHRIDPWLEKVLRRLLPGGWWPALRRRGARLPSWLMLAAIAGLVLVNYTQLVPAAQRLDDMACTSVAAVPADLCRSGLGTARLLLDDGTIEIGLRPGDGLRPFDTSSLNGPERAAENLILRANRDACAPAAPHITLAVTTALSRTVDDTSLSADEVGIEDLRGAYLAQSSFNGSHRTKICLVVANVGNLDSMEHTDAVAQVVQRLVLYAKHDPSFAGVVGFPFSTSASQALAALRDLGQPPLPIVSPSVTSTDLNGAHGFWRIASTDDVQARALVDFLDWQLGSGPARRLAVLVDDKDSYSNSLGNRVIAYANRSRDGGLRATELHYTVQDRSSIVEAVSRAGGADYVMLAGYAYDLDALELALQAAGGSVTILGGDGLYDLERYNDHPYAPVFATGYTPPLGAALVETQPCPIDFTRAYDDAFTSPAAAPTPSAAITFLSAHAIEMYDAVCMYGQALEDLGDRPFPDRAAVLQALPRVSFDGLSGHTRFGDPIQLSVPDSKPVYVMCTDRDPTPRLAAQVDRAPDGQPIVRPSKPGAPRTACP